MSGKIMAPWTFSIKFSYSTQFTFRSLMFAAGEDKNLKLLTQASTKAFGTNLWTGSISSSQFIYIRRGLLRFEFLCRVIPSHRKDSIGAPDRGTHHPAID
jgi:hypothetical protein